jgi:hypothetical protein
MTPLLSQHFTKRETQQHNERKIGIVPAAVFALASLDDFFKQKRSCKRPCAADNPDF